MHTHLEQWEADTAAPGEQLGVRCLAQGSHLSYGQFLPEPRFEPTTSGYKSNALYIRPQLPPQSVHVHKENESLHFFSPKVMGDTNVFYSFELELCLF